MTSKLLIAALAIASAHAQTNHPLLLAHYMPWFQADATKQMWGWHWTMNHFDPRDVENGQRQIASHYHPLIGPYDNDDPDVVAYEVMLMKLSGIDGVLIDWYGVDDLFDYAANQKRTLRIIEEIKRAHMKFAIVYEDQTVPHLIDAHKFPKRQTEAHINQMFRWMDTNWFHDPSYIKFKGKPLLLDFGPQYFKNGEWPRLFAGVSPQPAFVSLMNVQGPAVGAYDWPMPHDGDSGSAKSVDSFYNDAKRWPLFIPAAFPRFDDIYHEAGVGPSYGHISGDDQLYEQLLKRGIKSGARFVQLVTWNDWGEGTQIEPSFEKRFQSLTTTQRLKKELIDSNFDSTEADLEMVFRWYQLHTQPRMTAFPSLIYAGKIKEAAKLIRSAYR